jgi:uncharacterized protein (DUF2141 family)
MINKLIPALFLVCLTSTAFSQYNLDIEITGLKNDKGNLMLQLLDSNEKVLSSEMSVIKENKCSFKITGLAAGRYAVRYYHDENLNGKMDTNLVGKPVEGYGFSNNVTGKFGPPAFEKWLFDIGTDMKIVLKATY